MSIITHRAGPAFSASVEITTIDNGYLVSLRGRPSRDDPLGQHDRSVFAATPADIGEACGALITALAAEREQDTQGGRR